MSAWGKPEGHPPSEKNKGELITRFRGFIDSDQTTSRGLYKLVLLLPKDEKWKASLAVEKQHTMLYFEVYGPGEIEMDDDIMELLGAENDNGSNG